MSADLGRAAATGDMDSYLAAQVTKPLLRFITCGSVDDGKSTLIGRLLYEAKLVYDDQLAELEVDSRRFGTQGAELDLALLVDGLAAEREQGITIDVAYRFFSTDRRSFIVADAPGHEQYTRNMVTGASTADLAVLLVDARKGILTQTRRHTYLVSLLGIAHIVLAINKLDLVDWSEPVVREIEAEYRAFADALGVTDVTCVPMSALTGDNVTIRSDRTPWYDGPTLLGYLEHASVTGTGTAGPFRMPVQYVNRPGPDFRGFAGTVVRGSLRPGDEVVVQPAGTRSTVQRIVTQDGDLDVASAGRAVTLTLADDIDVSRGDMLSAAADPAEVADQFEADVIWLAERPMLPGRSYLLKHATRTVPANISHLKHAVNVNTLERSAASTLHLNEIGACNIALDQPVAFDPYAVNRELGAFILIDRETNDTVGAGMLHFALRRSHNVHWQAVEVDQTARSTSLGHRPCVVWFTGLSGAGKSTIANLVEKQLYALGCHTYLLDGDNLRHGITRDLGFTDADRVENIRRVAEVARLMADAGLVVLVSLISPFAADRRMARALVEEGQFCEVFVDTPLSVAEDRDRKGLYAKARQGELPHFTGIDSPYERPADAEIRIDTTLVSEEDAATAVLDRLHAMRVIERVLP